jgi:hypothetical protein
MGSKKLDMSDLRKLVADNRIWGVLGIVYAPAGQQHYSIEEGDVLVEVETVPDQLDMTCRLGSAFGGAGRGIWDVPPVGSEVLVMVPSGRIDFQPTIVSVLSSGAVPAGIQEGRTIIVSGEVLIYDGDPGEAEPVAKKSDVERVRDEFIGHVHGPGPAPPFPTTGPLEGPAGTTPIVSIDVNGTTILKSK